MQFAICKFQDCAERTNSCIWFTKSVILFFSSLEDVTNELNSFMDLFHHLALLFSESDKSPPLLDVDCKGSILGEIMFGLQPFNHSWDGLLTLEHLGYLMLGDLAITL